MLRLRRLFQLLLRTGPTSWKEDLACRSLLLSNRTFLMFRSRSRLLPSHSNNNSRPSNSRRFSQRTTSPMVTVVVATMKESDAQAARTTTAAARTATARCSWAICQRAPPRRNCGKCSACSERLRSCASTTNHRRTVKFRTSASSSLKTRRVLWNCRIRQ